MWCTWMVRQLVWTFGDDWSSISYSCPYTSMLNLVICPPTPAMLNSVQKDTKFNIEVYGQLYEIMFQSSPNFNTSYRTIWERSSENCWNTSQKCVSYTKLVRSNRKCGYEVWGQKFVRKFQTSGNCKCICGLIVLCIHDTAYKCTCTYLEIAIQ